MTSAPLQKEYCREPGCGARVVFATPVGRDRARPYEADDRPPFSQQALGADVIVGRQAWKPADLIEDYMVRLRISEDAARELVAGYPFHRPHAHERTEPTPEETQPR